MLEAVLDMVPVVPVLTDAAGTEYSSHAEAQRGWRQMQPEISNPDVRPIVGAGDREVYLFEFPADVAKQGLYLHFSPPCEEPLGSPHFCLGRRKIVTE